MNGKELYAEARKERAYLPEWEELSHDLKARWQALSITIESKVTWLCGHSYSKCKELRDAAKTPSVRKPAKSSLEDAARRSRVDDFFRSIS